MTGAGPKAFCAGGDVASLAKQNQESVEGQKKSKDFFGLEYQLDHLIATYPKPYVAILDGITMGGGVGLSVHAQFRIATEKTVFAMPETTIGFFPDVGGSFFLPRMDGEVGTYLALTSERLTGVQAYYSGIATHYFHSSSLANLINRLGELVFRDNAPLSERLTLVNRTIAEFSTGLPPLDEEPILFSGSLRRAIDRCFCHDTIEEVVSHLEREKEEREWAEKTLQTLSSRSPTALKVTLRALRLGRHWSIAETFQREHHIAGHFMAHPDFVEGVTARLMNKPPTEPQWTPPSLQDVTSDDVDRFFRIPAGEGRLQLLQKQVDYKEYPYAQYALPSESAVLRRVAEGKARYKDEIVGEFVQQWEGKDGVMSKVEEILERKTEETKDGLRII
jgi:3-hydroxyisobutyryl-CoA hydrolase